jgi:hypothetical protein
MSEQVDSYQSWMERQLGGRDARPLVSGEIVESSAAEPFGVIEFAKTERAKYNAEVGKKAGDYVYHFFPKDGTFPPNFEALMGDAFLAVWMFPERIQASFTPELNSWAVRAVGFATNPLSDDLAISLFAVLDLKLE